jgi:hypothetical protein
MDDDDKNKNDAPSSKHHAWLRKTEYMGGYVVDDKNAPEKRKVKGVSKLSKHANIDEEMDSIENDIEKSFEFTRTLDEEFEKYQQSKSAASLKTLKHPSKPNLKPVGVYSVLPNEPLWANNYLQIAFDTDPIFAATTPAQDQAETRASEGNKLYRGTVLKQSGKEKTSVSFIKPKNREKNFVDEQDEQEYQFVREYIFNQESTSKDRFYFLTLDDETKQAGYNQLRGKLNMKKKKAKLREEDENMDEAPQDKKHPRYLLTRRDFIDREITLQNRLRDELSPEDALNEEDEEMLSLVTKKT